ncbi:OLC1v1008964C1, partial [Oldenlandia corymbosa var. corymbosa]
SPAREPTPPPPPQPPRVLQEQALNAITDEWEPRLFPRKKGWDFFLKHIRRKFIPERGIVMVTMLCKRAGVTFLHTDAESNLQQPLRMHKLDQKPPGASSAGQTTSTPTPTGQMRQRDFNKQT